MNKKELYAAARTEVLVLRLEGVIAASITSTGEGFLFDNSVGAEGFTIDGDE